MQDSSIQLAEPVCTIVGASENDHRAVVAWPCLVHVGAGAAHKNECAWSKVKVADHVHVMFLKLVGRGEAAGDDAVVDGGKVG